MVKYNILITGGAGYLGTHLVNQFIANDLIDQRLIVYSRDELKQFDLKIGIHNHAKVKFVIGDVRDQNRLMEAMQGIDIVIHAAAMKHVSICEENPSECVKTNINGTENVIKACQSNGVKKLIFVSTDKAVEPVSVYGDSKQMGERLVLNSSSQTLKSTVIRLGNLIGSTGSVVDKLLKIGEEETFFIYNPEMTRFWDSLTNAWFLINKSITGNFENVVFISKLKALNILDLAKSMTNRIEVREMNQRSEKKHEKLVADNEMYKLLENERFYILPKEQLTEDEALEKYRSLNASIREYSSDKINPLSSKEVAALLNQKFLEEI